MTTCTNVAALGWLAAAALGGTAVHAQDSGWYGGASIGRSAATIDEDRIRGGLASQGLATREFSERDRDTAFRLFGGYQVNRYFGIEGGWFDMGEMGYTASTTPGGSLRGDVRLRGMNLDLVGSFPLSERFSLLGRVGGAYVQTRGAFAATGAVVNPYGGTSTSENKFGVKIGAGVAWRVTEAWELRAEAERMRIDDSVGNKGHVDLLSLSVVYRFGAPAPVQRSAAPAPVMAVAAPMPPPAPAPVAVAPPAPAPAPAPVVLPPRMVTVHFSADALFDFDRSTLRPEGLRQLDAFAGDLRNVQYDNVRVVGHTDRIGTARYNEDLSRRRADAVAGHLAQAGLPATRLASSGAGESAPVTAAADCRGNAPTPTLIACLQPDRRVEVQVDGMRSAAP
jgi:OOP family OmpA-OmpF porin